MGVIFTILTLLLLSLTIYCQVSRITLNPTTLILTNDQIYGTVVITCQPPADADIQTLYFLGIKRNTNSYVDQNVGSYKGGNNPPTVNPSISGATITGGSTSNSITITLSQVSCTDAGVYKCDAIYIDSQDISHSLLSSDNLTVKASPGNITLTPEPLDSTYPNGTRLTLRCNGRIGSEEVQWVWQYKNKDLGAGWSAYVPQSENDISTDPPSSIPNSCQKTQESRLSRVLTTDDDGRTYRCFVQRGNLNFDQYADEYVIYVGSQGPTSAPNTSKASSASVGPIVGGVIGGLLLLTIIIVLVYFLWYRKRDKGEKYHPKENSDLPKPADETGPYPSYPPSSIPPSQTRFKRGVANKAMDETEEKPDKKTPVDSKPPRYDNDFRKGGYNPGYDVDHQERPRRYSSDDGGTDRSVNLSVGDGDPNMGTAI